MPYIMQAAILLVLGALLVRFLKPYPLRKWLGVAMLAAGLVGIFNFDQQQVLGFDLELLALLAVPLGAVLFMTRRRFTEVG
ncbi:hypothetical protein N5E96_14410 [Pseudomonas mosselii]|uniref:hypothetical protein n=1 Tax=Pseudomonas mosselii TaxID=78327 RepID=UPI000782C938|nr:hypothetical protein [Pseudomonas mosselii]MDH1657264.1 hypothetical protein [Pseudomonas mosselii]MDH1717026.1 hypothetical protein [Pseudomonas mosselii]MDH1722471.1 hypothetical protein [Pseudomonas mosselii]MDN4497405.1 hypothetical protein [Pseudomonas mosselii]ORT69848.1 hypothetical protein BTA49_13880 [Pseudomonas mosselii]